ncbi:MAG: DUF6488 family protein [Gammaproteobacteria bacterium]|nr:DUF6488 family protein [Gammaproteobacteria bacterium]
MKNIVLIFLLFVTFVQNANAHPGGHGPVNEQQAIEEASYVVEQFTLDDVGLGFDKLAKSWAQLPEGAKRVHKKTDDYYIISLQNEAEGRTLYILMSLTGSVFDANFSGDFPKLMQ